MAINSLTGEGAVGLIILTIGGSPGQVQMLQRILETIEAAAVDNTTTCNGLLDRNEQKHKAQTTTEANQTLYSHRRTVRNIQVMTRRNLHKKKRICSGHQRIYKWRIGRIPGLHKVQTTKVILQLRTPSSVLLSSPKLLKRLQLKLLQILTPE